ncbi:hypothetical protein K443DRAFT_128691 [Laccaria amethystina LaAM-08-1]|uniref:DNA damage-binding protein CMR1 n=1 Tax=Laccaria amethystina LaAM-08-1 TaxID=1095629 RepID=A0A0C9YD87_9AGAR|nr:hypothetical protein K443DRAFT_128691 [Laccaria amethystina LaAM-08-1]
MVKLSQYEIEREANIARNRALLEQLELKQAVETLGVPKHKGAAKSTAKPVQPAKRVKRERLEPEAPRRQSARLRRDTFDPDESPSKRQKREQEQRAKEEEERLAAEEQARMAKKPRHQKLDLISLAENGPEDVSTLSEALESVAQSSGSRHLGDPDAFLFDGTQEAAAVKDLKERLQGMKVVSRAKVTQDRIYCAAYHPEVTKDLIFFGDKHGQLGIWDARAQGDEVDEDGDISLVESEGGKYWRLQLHWPASSKSSISSIKLDPTNSHSVYTSSYDCTIRHLSFTTGISEEIFASSNGELICSIDLTSTGNEMWVSDGAGGATHIDLREKSSKHRRYVLSEQKIGCISINPTRNHFILTASNSRLLKIWDVRKMQGMKSGINFTRSSDDGVTSSTLEFDTEVVSKFMESKQGEGCLRAEWRHEKSVSSAYWDPRGRQIVSTSYDDTIRLWDLESNLFNSPDPFPTLKPFSRIKHNCQTGKWLTILRAQWTQNPEVYPHFTIANMNHAMDIYSCKGDLLARLADPTRISAVQAVTCSHPSIVERAVSGNASGRCILWAPQDS